VVLGGWLVEQVSWRAVFFINLPIAAIVLAVLLLRVPESQDESASPALDGWGALLATLGLGGVVFGPFIAALSALSRWSALALASAASAGLMLRETATGSGQTRNLDAAG